MCAGAARDGSRVLGLTPGEQRESTGYIQEDDDGSGIRQDKDKSSSYKYPEQGQKREKGCSPVLGGPFLTSTERTGKGRAALALYWKSRGRLYSAQATRFL